MNNVNSEKASNAVADALIELGFKNYIVLVGNKNTEEFDVVFNGDAETLARLTLSLLDAAPEPVRNYTSYLLENNVIPEALRKGYDD